MNDGAGKSMTYTINCKLVKNVRLITYTLVLLLVVATSPRLYASGHSAVGSPFSLKDTLWDRAADGTGIKPELLYAFALQETREMNEQGMAVPDPFVIRYKNTVSRFENFDDAKEHLDYLISQPETNLKRLDIGIMQFNAGWHDHRVEKLSDFLVPQIAIRAAAELLAEIKKTTTDPVFMLGRYHSYTPELTIRYGSSVQGIYCRLITFNDLEICGGIYGQK